MKVVEPPFALLKQSGLAATIVAGLLLIASAGSVDAGARDANVVSWWSFDEGSGTSATDSVGTNTGTIHNAAWTNDGVVLSAIAFDGDQDWIAIPDSDTLDFGTSDFTIELWAKHSTHAATDFFDLLFVKASSMEDAEIDTGYGLAMKGPAYSETNRYCARIGKGDGAGFFNVDSTNAFHDGEWHHVAAVFDRDGYMTVYVDGEMNAQVDISGTVADLDNDSTCYMGGRTVGNRSWNGAIDEVRIYNKALSAEEIGQNMVADRQMGRVYKYIPALDYSMRDRLPLVSIRDPAATEWEMQSWIDRGFSSLFKSSFTWWGLDSVLDGMHYFNDAGVPIVIMPISSLQNLFNGVGGGCDHQPPAEPQASNTVYRCPAWMYETPMYDYNSASQIPRISDMCATLEAEGITPRAILYDYESGPELRNSAELEANVWLAIGQATNCPRCVARFGIPAMDTPEEYQDIVDAARAYSIKTGQTDIVGSFFPDCYRGGFFDWPVDRSGSVAGTYSAYGWPGSGNNAAGPRVYWTLGWWGSGADQTKADRYGFLYCLQNYSRCAAVMDFGNETMIPWIGHVESGTHSQEENGYAFTSPDGIAEIVKHSMLRGAETFAMYSAYKPEDDFPDYYSDPPRPEAGPWVMLAEGVQAGYNAMLKHHGFLRTATPLNFKIDGTLWLDPAGLQAERDTVQYVWSGAANDTRALVRTISFNAAPAATNRTLTVWGQDFPVPFEKGGGASFWLYKDSGLVFKEGEEPPIGDISIAIDGSDAIITWAAGSGSYALQSDANLVEAPSWGDVQTNIPGVDGSMSATTTTTAAESFYRIILEE